MYSLLVRSMLISVMIQLGLSFSDFQKHGSLKIKKALTSVLTVQWRPISVFPEEARQFRQ